jgi:hypothetical protein
MADFDSSLPIRTENNGDVVSKICDATVESQQLKVNADGSIDVNAEFAPGTKVIITDGTDDLAINADGSVNAVVSATDLDIRDLDETTDSVTAHQGGTWSVDVANTVTVQSTDLDIRDLAFATDKVDVSGSDVTVSSLPADVDIRDLTAASDSVAAHLFDEAGVAFSSSNPLPVEFFENQTEAFDYDQASAIAGNASSTHTYAAPANFKLKEAFISASGKVRAELKINSVTVAVGFNSTANPNISFRFDKGLNASGVNIEIVKTNLDKQSQDLYSTIVGLS